MAQHTRESVADWLKQTLIDEHLVLPTQIRDDAQLEDLGLDSLDAVELELAIEERYELHLADGTIGTADTFKALVDLVASQLQEAGDLAPDAAAAP